MTSVGLEQIICVMEKIIENPLIHESSFEKSQVTELRRDAVKKAGDQFPNLNDRKEDTITDVFIQGRLRYKERPKLDEKIWESLESPQSPRGLWLDMLDNYDSDEEIERVNLLFSKLSKNYSIDDFEEEKPKKGSFTEPKKILDDKGKEIKSRIRASKRGSHVVIWILSKGSKDPVDSQMEIGRKLVVERMRDLGLTISAITTGNENDKVRGLKWWPTAEQTLVRKGPVEIGKNVDSWCDELWARASGIAAKDTNNQDRPLHFYIRSELEPEAIANSIIHPVKSTSDVIPSIDTELSEPTPPRENNGWNAEVYVNEFLTNRGWETKLVGHLHMGYDITASKGDTNLLVEVKSSVDTISPSFTENEFGMWRDNDSQYIVAILENFDQFGEMPPIQWVKIPDGDFSRFKIETVKKYKLNRTVWTKLSHNSDELEI